LLAQGINFGVCAGGVFAITRFLVTVMLF